MLLQLLQYANDDALRALHRKLQVGAVARLLLRLCMRLPIAAAYWLGALPSSAPDNAA